MTQVLEELLHAASTSKRQETRDTVIGIYARHGVAYGETLRSATELAREICLDGSNTLASVLRGWEPVSYLEVVRDVAKELKVPGVEQHADDVEWLEQQALFKVLADYFDKAPQAERGQFEDVLRRNHVNLGGTAVTGALTTALWASLLRQVGPKVVAQIVRRLVASSAGWFAARQAAKTAARVAGVAIPVVNVAMTAWLVVDVASPAMRKTLPTVMDIALLRMELDQ